MLITATAHWCPPLFHPMAEPHRAARKHPEWSGCFFSSGFNAAAALQARPHPRL